jgi:hypothetical protein
MNANEERDHVARNDGHVYRNRESSEERCSPDLCDAFSKLSVPTNSVTVGKLAIAFLDIAQSVRNEPRKSRLRIEYSDLSLLTIFDMSCSVW